MSACVKQQQSQFLVILPPQEQPVGFYVTLPDACIIAGKDVRTVLGWQRACLCKEAYYCLKVVDVKPTTLTELIGFLESAGVMNRVLHASSCAIRSSTLLAS